MYSTEMNQDIIHIMDGIIRENNFIESLDDQNTEYEIKNMTLIIFSEIYDINKSKVKTLINKNFKSIKNDFLKKYTDAKVDDFLDIKDINNKTNSKEIFIDFYYQNNQDKIDQLSEDNIKGKIESSDDDSTLKFENDKNKEDTVVIIEKKIQIQSKNQGKINIKKEKRQKNIKKKEIINFKDNLQQKNPEIFDFCNKLIYDWECKTEAEKIEYLKNQVEYLANLPQPEQRSEEWYKFRKGMLTASDLYKAIGTEGIRRALIIKKCKNSTTNSSGIGNACKHGIKYEDIAILIYEKIKNVKIFDYGCIQDKEFKIFGASPDGICGKGSGNMIGTMLEIKCPTSRKIVDGEVPQMYWKQIQGQLEVCKLWECDFLECKIIECTKEEFVKSEKEKGIVIDILYNDTNNTGFIYAPLHLFPNNYEKWLDNELDKIIDNDNITFLKISYWILNKMNCVKVKRDPHWFYSKKPEIIKFWNEVIYHRENGYENLESKTKRRKKKKNYEYSDINECIIQSDSE